jgi:hypothetical protein
MPSQSKKDNQYALTCLAAVGRGDSGLHTDRTAV